MKKIIQVFVGLGLFCVLSVNAFATGTYSSIEFSFETEGKIKSGEEFKMDFIIGNVSNVGSITAYFEYDREKLEFISLEENLDGTVKIKSGLTYGENALISTVNFDETQNKIILASAGSEAWSSDREGIAFTVFFKVKDDVNGEAEVWLNTENSLITTDSAEEEIDLKASNIKVEIVEEESSSSSDINSDSDSDDIASSTEIDSSSDIDNSENSSISQNSSNENLNSSSSVIETSTNDNNTNNDSSTSNKVELPVVSSENNDELDKLENAESNYSGESEKNEDESQIEEIINENVKDGNSLLCIMLLIIVIALCGIIFIKNKSNKRDFNE